MTPTASKPGRATGNCIVEASAGTGKTRELVSRIVRAVIEGCDIDRIVAVTFTHAAAGEMKLRIRQELDKARQNSGYEDAGRKRAGAALQQLERAFIGTIHSFCAQMLRQRPVEAKVDPAFGEMSQPEAYALFSREFQLWIQQKLAAAPAVFHRLFARYSWRNEDPVEALKGAAWQLSEWRDFPTQWRREKVAWHQQVDQLFVEIDAIVRMAAGSTDPNLQPLKDCADRFHTARAIGRNDYDAWESELVRLPEELRWFNPREPLRNAWRQLRANIEHFRELADADLASALRDELWPMVELYDRTKRGLGKLDFADLLISARNLLRNDAAREYFQGRYQRLFIDEFQDTDPLQADILRLLCEERLFLVGDPKQSIYRFRRADVKLYRDICEGLATAGASSVTLSASRRSVAPIQEFVNAAFANMPQYIPLTEGREAIAGQPAIIALPMPRPYSSNSRSPSLTKKAVNECGPNTVAAFIEWLLARKWRVSDREDPSCTREIRDSDICILFRRFVNFKTDLTAEYVRCMEARGIRHVLVGSKSFHRREEVVAIRTALRAIEWPGDELSVFATIRGSLFAVWDGTLLKFRHQFGPLHPFRELPDDLDAEFAPIKDALDLLANLHRRRNYRPIADTISRLLEHCRAHAGLACRNGGERVLGNVLRLCDLSRQFEGVAATSFRSFIEYLEDQETSRESSDPTVLEQEGEGVRLMTVHHSKGLEFPVVILADLTAQLTSDRADRVIDASRGVCAQPLMRLRPWELLDPANLAQEQQMNREEGERVAYVAATRARDLLVVSAIGENDREFLDDTWLSPLHPALYPAREMFRKASKADGCEFRGDSTVLNGPLEGGPDDESIKPGLHRPQRGKHGVVWFDPAALDLSDRKSKGLQYEDLLAGPTQEGLDRYYAWQGEQKQIREKGERAAFHIERATDAILPDSSDVEVVRIPKQGSRPAGRAFGKLVHALLQQAALPVRADDVEAIARVEARILESDPQDVEFAIRTAVAALQHELLAGVAGATRVHREFPVLLRDGEKLIEGVIDVAFLKDNAWTIVDFKTGPADKKRNRGQLALYRRAMERATGKAVRAILFEI